MRALRSVLFVPGHKADWIQKALSSSADGIIIDLEDAVPETDKALARENARTAISSYSGGKTVLVRVNGLETPHFGDDARAVAVEGVGGLLLPMLRHRDDVVAFDGVIAAAEILNGVPRGSVEVVPSFETAESIVDVESILSGPRVGGVMAAAAKDADISRAVGFRWSAQGLETLYLRSRILLAARAAGLELIVLGLWQDVRDLDGMRTFARDNAALGFTGQVLIHPTHADIANEEYGLSNDRVDYYRRLIAAFEAGERAGHGAVSFEGEHIDLAHANNAREQLRRAGLSVVQTAE
ncbi:MULTISPECIES: CoA ester lyase [unclassified Microbacterium]|uniref:HpcH/HpaI aldolase/citrate lyase family protein n=1 Tax=unclassified Microbacterium TaxID=2609290 RepID=UPI001DE9C0C0|nr:MULTISPECIES: CoA ester lyase [unclassified Microbacterium]CAH0156179.1 (3S)-malyl-CoA thioesterase [Microbacterium sp. Bi121]HWK78557.1 CoA ester lyase [Microbacterium sp.]